MKGYVHSLQSLGTVDGPGVRSVVFLSGCPLRCVYCHNPDTREFFSRENEGATPPPSNGGAGFYEVDELVTRILRYRSYFGERGGVTVSGGEPLLQADFAYELFGICRHKIVQGVGINAFKIFFNKLS